jgi:crossover junction endodeoxyribonuclease RuvC
MSAPTLILGVDPGSHVTGYGIVLKDGNRFDYVDSGTIRPKGESPEKRYYEIFDGLEKIILSHNIHVASVESQFYLQNAQTLMKLSIARACVLIACGKNDIPVFEYAPRKAKIAVSGNGAATKEQVQKMIKLHLRQPNLTVALDASDALALALCHAYNIKPIQVR